MEESELVRAAQGGSEQAKLDLLALYAPWFSKFKGDKLSEARVAFLEALETHDPTRSRMATRMRWFRPTQDLLLLAELDTLEAHVEEKETEETVMERQARVTKLLSKLDEVEARVVRAAYGFMDAETVQARLDAGFAEDECLTDRQLPLLGIPGVRSKSKANRVRLKALEKMRNG